MAVHRITRKPLSCAQFLSTVLPGSAAMTMGLLTFSGAALADSANPWADISAVSGSISKDLSVANVNTITQHTDRTVTTASSADILSNQTVNILQNNSGSLFVLKTTGADQDGAQIQGALNANGRVMVLDRNGVFFGANSRIDVGGIVASTGDVDNDAVMRGDTTLTLKDFGDAAVVNDGLISVSGSGLAALVAPQVANNGIIQARLGKVALASGGESATVDLYGDGLVELAVGGKTGKALAENSGVIEGSTVLMTASGAKEIVDTVINMSGVIHATSATVQGGKIILGGGNAGKVKVSGVMAVSGTDKGGSVDVTGENIEVTKDAFVVADATSHGDGGNIKFMAENDAAYRGNFFARGGANGGNGGFVELSAKNRVGYDGAVNTSAANGVAGTFLMDPLFAIIHSGWLNNPLGFEYLLSAQALANDIHRNGAIVVQADQFIDVGTDLSFPLVGVGNGDIDFSTYDYSETTISWIPVCGFLGCINLPVPVTTDYHGTNTGNITLLSDIVNVNKNILLGYGGLHVDANTVNLNGIVSDPVSVLLDPLRITGTAGTVNVISDSALIQQGVYMAANNATVNVAAGHYNESVKIDKKLTLLGANAGIAGNGVRSAETLLSPNSPGFHVTADGVVIDGFMITGASGGDGYGVWVDGADNTDIKNNVIDSSAQSGVQFTNANNGAATLNKITNSGDSGIRLDNSHNATASNNDISNSGIDGIRAFGSNFLTANSNIIKDVNGSGIGIQNSDHAGFDGNKITNANRGLWIGNSDDAAILNSEITDASDYGVYVHSGSNDARIKGNTVSNAGQGVYVGHSDSAIIQGNIINTPSIAGISIEGSKNTSISTNTISNSVRNGIRVADGSTNAAIISNEVNTSGWNGIEVIGSEGVRIAGNDINGVSGASGIAVMSGSHDAVIRDNTIDDIGRLGIYVWNSNRATLAENEISQTGLEGGANWYLSGIHLEGANDTVIANNDISGTGGDGIHIGGAGNQGAQATSGNIVRNNNISNAKGDGVEVVDSDGIIIRMNDVLDADGQGIFVDNSDGARINQNTITNVKLDGVKLEAGNDIIVGGNDIRNSGRVGIYSSKTGNLLIRNNTLDMTTFAIGSPYGAITTEQGANITIAGNTTSNSGHGIQMMWVDGVNEIRNNTINATANNGVHAEDVENLTISANKIGLLGGALTIKGHGIHVSVSDGVQILGNQVSNTAKRGINLHLGALATVKNNLLDKIGQEGVRTEQVHGLEVTNNTLTNIGWNGMDIQGGSNVTLHNNMLNMIGGRGMNVAGAQIATTITGNDISNTGESGIVVNGTKDTLIRNNLIHTVGKKNNADYSGIDANNVTNGLIIANNHIGYTDRAGTEGSAGNIKHIGISVKNSDEAVLRNNMLTMSRDGVVLSGNNRVRLLSNVINNAGANGLYASGQNNGRIVLIGNEFNDNTTGALFESGRIDLDGTANIFNGGTAAMRFDPTAVGDPSKLSLIGNTIGTTEFTGQSQYYIQLANGAFFAPGMPTVLNALNARYEGFSPSSVGGVLTLPQYNALESKFFHFNDNPTLGLFFFGAVPVNFDDSDIYNSYGAYTWANGRFRMTILSLPHLPGAPSAGAGGAGGQPSFAGNVADFLANIAPAAGGDNSANLASIEPAAGNNVETTCWSDAISRASAGTAVSYSFGGTNEEALSQTAACGSAL